MNSSTASSSVAAWTRATLHLFFEPIIQIRSKRTSASHALTVSGRAKALRVATELISSNQPNLIEYIYSSSQKHKALRIALAKNQKSKYGELRSDLIKYLNSKFFSSVSDNFTFLHSYFANRADSPPRIAIKGSFKTENRDAIITIFRDCEVPYEHFAYLDDNTGVRQAYRTGRYFICNDIVEAAAAGDYINPRIKSDAVKAILKANPFHPVGSLRRQWLTVWNRGSRKEDAFQSTLVIPIALSRTQISEEFIASLGMEGADRIIFGFLCIDHQDKGYFDEESDVPFCYAVADLISLYAFTRLQFTDFSSTFDQTDLNIDPEEMMGSISAAVKEAISEATERSKQEGQFSVEATANNKLIADDSLVDLIIRAGRGELEEKEISAS